MKNLYKKITTIFALTLILYTQTTYASRQDILRLYQRSDDLADASKRSTILAKRKLQDDVIFLEEDFDEIFSSDYFKNHIDASNPKAIEVNLTEQEKALRNIETQAEKIALEQNMRKAYSAAVLVLVNLEVDISLLIKD